MINPAGLLYIEPSAKTSDQPIIDELTRKMTAAYRKGEKGNAWRGVHTCACGAHSSNCDYMLPGRIVTNSLCIHYLAFHRDEVPESELEKVRQLGFGEEDPTTKELAVPGQKLEAPHSVTRSFA